MPGLILTDLIFALVFTYLFVKVGAALGGGRMAGVKLGLLVAVLSPVIGGLYQYFSVTYMSVGLTMAESVFQIIAHAIEGAVAGAIYKAEVVPKIEAVRSQDRGFEVFCRWFDFQPTRLHAQSVKRRNESRAMLYLP